jgi:hypothetical protein
MPGVTGTTDAPSLSFTVAQFVGNCFTVAPSSSTTAWYRVLEGLTLAPFVHHSITEDMIDDMISKGISPMVWMQANVPNNMLDDSIIHKVALDEDEEPNTNYYGTSFPSASFLDTVAKASYELSDALPSREPTDEDPNPDGHALPNASCESMHTLTDMLDELEKLRIAPCQYVRELQMPEHVERRPFIICLQLSDDHPDFLLSDALRVHLVVNYMFRCYDLLMECEDLHNASLFREDMRCGHCWCDYDEVMEDGRDNTPVRAPCPYGHVWRKRELETVGSGDRVLDHCSLLETRAVRYIEAKKKASTKERNRGNATWQARTGCDNMFMVETA